MPPNRFRPPEATLSADVYAQLRQSAQTERLALRGAARPYGAIVMDAVEAHADRLRRTWTAPGDAPDSHDLGGGLFARPTAVPRRRRHASPPTAVVLSGIDATNAELLDRYAADWGAGTRSALVEQALRYEYRMA